MAAQFATLAGGCFWCYETIFSKIKGVKEVIVGYTGGHTKNPTYSDVTSGKTGHVEAINIKYDDEIISFDELLNVFWKVHDPTQTDGQGNDIGEQYMSVIFYHNDDQEEAAKASKEIAQEEFSKEIITKIKKAQKFYPAEYYHQNYYENNKNAPYCQLIISPKLKKFLENYQELLK